MKLLTARERRRSDRLALDLVEQKLARLAQLRDAVGRDLTMAATVGVRVAQQATETAIDLVAFDRAHGTQAEDFEGATALRRNTLPAPLLFRRTARPRHARHR